MSDDDKPTLIGPLAGIVVGVVVFLGVSYTSGWAIIPTRESVVSKSWGLSAPERPDAGATAVAAGGVYQTVCQTCHQADGQGVSGAFPPLAGSEWVVGDPETPIRIALLGLKGAIDVKGMTYNSLMPPPPGMTDEKIVEAVNHIRTNFGNQASEITIELVQEVKASLGGRTDPWTAAELSALRAAGGREPQPTPADGGAAGEPDTTPAEAAPTGEPAPEGAPAGEPAMPAEGSGTER
jgi:mono/diheme cytochrome c family protein